MGFPRAKPLGRSLVTFCRGQKVVRRTRARRGKAPSGLPPPGRRNGVEPSTATKPQDVDLPRGSQRATIWKRAIATFRLLLVTTPGTTYALAQPLAAKRRGGSAFCPKRKIAPATLQGAISTFRILLHSTPGTTYAPAQPLGAKRRGGSGASPPFDPACFLFLPAAAQCYSGVPKSPAPPSPGNKASLPQKLAPSLCLKGTVQ